MKKVVLCILLLLCVAGCSVVRINTSSIDTIINVILSKNNSLYNRVGRGYKYYVPRGVTYIDTNELNEKLYSDGNYYYLYVDTISYFEQIDTVYEENKSLYYSIKLTHDDGFEHDGYLEIKQKDDLYYITFVYNYAKIESVVSENDINDVVLNAAYILSTIQFNSDIIKLTADYSRINDREEKYELFKDKSQTNDSELQVID